MSNQLYISLAITVILFSIMIVYFLRKNVLNLKYSLLWILSCFVMVAMLLFPEIMEYITKLTGIHSIINSIFVISIFFILLILLSVTLIVSKLKEQNKRLAQTCALLEKQLREVKENFCSLESE